MSATKTYKSKLTLGLLDYTIEVTALNPTVAKAQFFLLEKYIRNGIEKDVVMSDLEYVKK